MSLFGKSFFRLGERFQSVNKTVKTAFVLPLQAIELTVWDGQEFQVSTTWSVCQEIHPDTKLMCAEDEIVGGSGWALVSCRADYEPGILHCAVAIFANAFPTPGF